MPEYEWTEYKPEDPIFYHKGGPLGDSFPGLAPGWYFWDEAWYDLLGPFANRAHAEIMLKEYCKTLDSPEPNLV